jgi:hypothetical protein
MLHMRGIERSFAERRCAQMCCCWVSGPSAPAQSNFRISCTRRSMGASQETLTPSTPALAAHAGNGQSDTLTSSLEYRSIGPRALLHHHLMLGLRSSCERVEFMFALVMALTPVSIWGATWSPLDAASAVFTPS